MGQEESPLISTNIDSSSEYNSERETSTRTILPLYISLPSILSPPLLSIDFLPFYNISQYNSNYYEQMIQ